MDKYDVKLYPEAYRNIDDIYAYISETLCEPGSAENVVSLIERTIWSLEVFPERGAILKSNQLIGKGYRHVFAGNYIIIYRVIADTKEVRVLTVRYSRSNL